MKVIQTSSSQQAIEAVEALSPTDQAELIKILQKRLQADRRQELVSEVQEVRQEASQSISNLAAPMVCCQS
jgi:ribosome recycling factor